MPITYHPSRYWDFCMPEDEKKKQRNCGHKQRLFLCLVTGYKNFFHQKRTKINMSCPYLLDVVYRFLNGRNPRVKNKFLALL